MTHPAQMFPQSHMCRELFMQPLSARARYASSSEIHINTNIIVKRLDRAPCAIRWPFSKGTHRTSGRSTAVAEIPTTTTSIEHRVNSSSHQTRGANRSTHTTGGACNCSTGCIQQHHGATAGGSWEAYPTEVRPKARPLFA